MPTLQFTQVNLVIDIGNTRLKAAIFEGTSLIQVYIIEVAKINEVKKILSDYPTIKFGIISSVINTSKEILNFFAEKINCIEFNQNTKLPIQIKYKSPETLGRDRIGAACGVHHLYPNLNALSIDAGTCIKFDFVNEHSEYLGGSISPGINMRFKALNNYTAKLPLLSASDNEVSLIGDSSVNSILSGVQNGAIAEVLAFINMYKTQYPNLNIVITGGDSHFFVDALKNSIFANPNLVLIGLNEILNYNVKHTN